MADNAATPMSAPVNKRRRRWIYLAIAVPLLAAIGYFSIAYYYPYSEGTRTGILRKLSHKGYVFKTWEGELQMSGISTIDAGQIVSGGTVWHFSAPEDEALIAKLRQYESMGVRVTLHYKEYIRALSWRGDTNYQVTAVTEAMAAGQKPAVQPPAPPTNPVPTVVPTPTPVAPAAVAPSATTPGVTAPVAPVAPAALPSAPTPSATAPVAPAAPPNAVAPGATAPAAPSAPALAPAVEATPTTPPAPPQ